jgi:hypothetical protein
MKSGKRRAWRNSWGRWQKKTICRKKLSKIKRHINS